MTKLLIKLFVKDRENTKDPKVRKSYGILSSIVGLLMNLVLFVLKLTFGLITKSMTVVADAVDSLSDSSTSTVSLLSFKFASKPADKKHPFGHARIEYVSALVISLFIIVVGIETMIESVKRIITPSPVQFHIAVVIIMVVTLLGKFWLLLFNKHIEKTISSNVISAVNADSLLDIVKSILVLGAYLLTVYIKINLDGYFGAIIALIIIYTGFKLFVENVNILVGELPTEEYTKYITNKLKSFPGVLSIHDLIVHNYGPNNHFISVHIEVDESTSLIDGHEIADVIEKEFIKENIQIICHIDPVSTNNPEIRPLYESAIKIVHDVNPKFGLHDFRVVKGKLVTKIIFDITLDKDFNGDTQIIEEQIETAFKKLDPKYSTVITFDKNYITLA